MSSRYIGPLISEQIRGTRPAMQVIDLSMPGGDSPYMDSLRWAARETSRLSDRAEELLVQGDPTSALRGIGYALLAVRAELAEQEERRP